MPDEIPFREHEVIWTREKSARFWDVRGRSPTFEATYFSRMVGDRIIEIAEKRIALSGRRILDFGCGRGFLTEKLARRGYTTWALDFSADSVATTKERATGLGSFQGATNIASLPSPFADGSFDVIFLLETLEHLLPDDLEGTARELQRLLTPGGHLVVTVPNEELLDEGKQFCPDCGGIFHRMQHVSSWDAARARGFLRANGMEPVFVQAMTLTSSPTGQLLDLARTALRRKKPNLFVIGRKR